MSVSLQEYQFDGIVGPTHHYGGLSYGNVASMKHHGETSHPKLAALQGLEKMKRVMEITGCQGFFPPHPRPHLPTLRDLGYQGTVEEILRKVNQDDPELLSVVSSSSAMWTANAATASPSTATDDYRLHITPANLASQAHRSIEVSLSTRWLRALFRDVPDTTVHDPVGGPDRIDEGAANHMRLGEENTSPLEIFVYGRKEINPSTKAFPARQTRKASEAVAAQHQLKPGRVLFLQQNPRAVDCGVFHNDVIAVTHGLLLFRLTGQFVQSPPGVYRERPETAPIFLHVPRPT